MRTLKLQLLSLDVSLSKALTAVLGCAALGLVTGCGPQPSSTTDRGGSGHSVPYRPSGATGPSPGTTSVVLTGGTTGTQTSNCANLIAQKYQAIGGPSSPLGNQVNPTVDGSYWTGTTWGGYCFADFEHGTMDWSVTTNAHYTVNGIHDRWAAMGWESSFLRLPTTDETPAPFGAYYNDFEHGSIYWTSTYGAKFIVPALRDKFRAIDGGASVLGYPVDDTRSAGNSVQIGQYSRFEHGSIDMVDGGAAHVVYGPTYDYWASSQYETGGLGFPDQDTVSGLDRGGSYTDFHGQPASYTAVYTPAGRVFTIRDPIRTRWHQIGSERSVLGYPVDSAFPGAGLWVEDFEHGMIVSSGYGTFEVVGDIAVRYSNTGSPLITSGSGSTYLGVPIHVPFVNLPPSQTRGGAPGSASQFQNGWIYSSDVGTFDMPNAIHDAWYGTYRGPGGCLGSPTSNWTGGTVNFEHGWLNWTSTMSLTGVCYGAGTTSGGTTGGTTSGGTTGGTTGGMCGGNNQACCANNSCSGQADCVDSMCRPRNLCSIASECSPGYNCEGSYCVPCGGAGQSCCWGGATTEATCSTGYVCGGNTCVSR